MNAYCSLQQPIEIGSVFPFSNSDSNQKLYEKGEYIYLHGEIANKIFLVKKGKVKISSYSPKGREMTKHLIKDGEIFGELCLIHETTRNDFAYALEDTEVHVLTIKEMREKMAFDPSLNMLIMDILGKRLLQAERKLELLVFQDARTRIIQYVRDIAEERGIPVGYEILVKDIATHQEIANITATSRQTVTSTLNEFKAKNIIYFNRKKILIRDLNKLC